MDYKNIYYKIIENAKKETENGNRHVGYYERHHIQPKSLGGNNKKENLVKLTAREHFICHWLLVKMYNKGINHLNGEQALGFARERYSFNAGDVQRGKNQMEVIKGVIKKLSSKVC